MKICVLRQLSGGLIRFDKDLMLTPRVAAEVPTVGNGRISSDGLTYTLKPKNGLIWSDGQPVTAGDFEGSSKRALSPDLAAPYSYLFSAIRGGAEYMMAVETDSAAS